MKVLGVYGDHAGRLVCRVGLDELGDVEVGLVANRHEARESHACLGGDQCQLDPEVAALRDQADRSGRELARCQVQLADGVRHAEAVRADEQSARRADPVGDRALDRQAVMSCFAQSRGDRDDRPRPRRQRIIDSLLKAGRADADDDEVDRPGHVGKRGVGALAEDVLAAAIDEEDAAPRQSLQGATREPIAPFGRRRRGAEDRERARIEERGQVARHQL